MTGNRDLRPGRPIIHCDPNTIPRTVVHHCVTTVGIVKILVPDDTPFDVIPVFDDPDDIAVPYSSTGPLPPEHLDADALVVWFLPPSVMSEAATSLPNLKWVQTLSAGTEAATGAGFSPSVTITSGRGLHDGPVAEHTLALILASLRRFHHLGAAKRRHTWDDEVRTRQASPAEGGHFTLDGSRVTVWGFGSIASRLAPLLTALGARVTGIASTAGTRNGFEVRDHTALEDLLPRTDVLVLLLPSTPETQGILSARLLSLLPPHSHVINAGRGSTIDEDALVSALNSGELAGAALDVTAVEPLPGDSPLWDAPNLILTPHIAGGRPQGVQEFLTDQVRRWRTGGSAALLNKVSS